MGGRRTTANELRARAKQLDEQVQRTSDFMERLGHVLQAMKFEVEHVQYVPPRNEVEKIITDIWQDVLGVEGIGIYDNFFDLGGQSILLLKVQRKMQDAFQHEISLIHLFKYPTINLLAERLKREADAVVELPSFQRSFDRAATRRELVSRQREVRKRTVAAE